MGLAVASRRSEGEIARELAITERTVKAHVGAILESWERETDLQPSLIKRRRALR